MRHLFYFFINFAVVNPNYFQRMKRLALLSYLLLFSVIASFADKIERVVEKDGQVWYKITTDDNLYGVADKKGKVLIPAKYDLLVYYDADKEFGGFVNYGEDNQCKSIWTLNGKCVIPESAGYTDIVKQEAYDDTHRHWYQVKVGDLYGACTLSGEVMVKPGYDNLFYGGNGLTVQVNDQYIALGVTLDNYKIAKPKIAPQHNDYANNNRNQNLKDSTFGGGKDGYDTSGVEYSEFSDIKNGFKGYKLSKGSKRGFADADRNIIIPVKYDLVTYHSSDGGWFSGTQNYGKRNQLDSAWDLYGNCIISEDRGYSDITMHTVDGAHVHWYSVERGKAVGACDAYGKEIIAPDKKYSTSLFYSSDGFNTKVGSKYVTLGITLDLSTPTYSDTYQPNKSAAKPRQNSYAQNNGNGSKKQQSPAAPRQNNTKPAVQQTEKFSAYAQRVVTERVKEWQEKGEFETSSEWHSRVNEATQKQKISVLIEEARKEYVTKYAPSTMRASIGKYDADNGVFPVKTKGKGTVYVSVPRAEAPTFKTQWQKVSINPKYGVINDTVGILSCSFKLGSKIYRTATDYADDSNSAVAQSLPKIEINVADDASPRRSVAQTTVKKPAIDNRIDIDIPVNKTSNDHTFAVIIGNENYQSVAKVPFAGNDAKVFAAYCNKTLGIPQKNIKVYQDATFGKILSAIKYVNQVSSAFNGDINIIFYYAGHGIPNESDKSAYLLPIDADGTQTEVCYGLNRLYSELGKTNAKSIVVFLDACFSGTQRGNGMVANVRGVAIKPRTADPAGNMVVLSAASGNQTAYPYEEKGHGLFTYYLLDKLQQSKGNVTIKELGDYITTNVQQQSVVINSKVQTPTITSSPDLQNWQSLKLKQ